MRARLRRGPEAGRRELARELGADVVLDPRADDVAREVARATDGRGADVAFEAVGIAATVGAAIAVVRRGATVTLVGNLSPAVRDPLQAVVTRRSCGCRAVCSIAGEYPAALSMIERGSVDVRVMLSAARRSPRSRWSIGLTARSRAS